jgi:predicted HTH domain antitoxin
MQIAIELPDDFVAFQAEPAIRKEITTSYALWLYQQERVTLAKAAELAGTDMYGFMQVCKDKCCRRPKTEPQIETVPI